MTEIALGQVENSCSEDDGVPDVGVAVGFGNGAALWLGELLNRDGATFGFVFHDGKGGRFVAPLPGDDDLLLRDLMTAQIAPALRALAAEQSRASTPAVDRQPWHTPRGGLIEAQTHLRNARRSVEESKRVNGHVPGNPYDVAEIALNFALAEVDTILALLPPVVGEAKADRTVQDLIGDAYQAIGAALADMPQAAADLYIPLLDILANGGMPMAGAPLEGWIVASGDGKRWRAWENGLSIWTDVRDRAVRYARREDAEQAHAEDDDAWTIERYAAFDIGLPRDLRQEAYLAVHVLDGAQRQLPFTTGDMTRVAATILALVSALGHAEDRCRLTVSALQQRLGENGKERCRVVTSPRFYGDVEREAASTALRRIAMRGTVAHPNSYAGTSTDGERYGDAVDAIAFELGMRRAAS